MIALELLENVKFADSGTSSRCKEMRGIGDIFSVGPSDVTTLSGDHSFALPSLTNPIPDPSVRLLSPTDFGEEPKKLKSIRIGVALSIEGRS